MRMSGKCLARPAARFSLTSNLPGDCISNGFSPRKDSRLSTRLHGTGAMPPSKISMATLSSSRKMWLFRNPGAPWPRTWWPASIFTEMSSNRERILRRGGANTHSGNSFIASRARLPTGAPSNIISPPTKIANASTMNLLGFVCINMAPSTARYGSTSDCISSTASATRATRKYSAGMIARARLFPWTPTGVHRPPPASSYRLTIPSTTFGS